MAVRVFGMLYTDYMRRTTPLERHLYRLFLLLEQKKDEHAREEMQQALDLERRIQEETALYSHQRGRT